MKTKKVNRYYCDFCKKSGCNAGHIKAHEEVCFRNPDRRCRVCAAGELKQLSSKTLLSALEGGLGYLREVANGCPACMVAAMMQERGDKQPSMGEWYDFDYKKEMDSFMGELRQVDY